MEELVARLQNEARYLGRGIIKADGFINHQLIPSLTMSMGQHFVQRFSELGVSGVNKIITAEVSGISPAFATACALNVPMVYARKHKPITMAEGVFQAQAPSRTKGGVVNLMVSPEYLTAADRVLLIDDFLATGLTIKALADLIVKSGAELLGIGCVVEKVFETGRDVLAELEVPVVTLAKVDLIDDDHIRIYC